MEDLNSLTRVKAIRKHACSSAFGKEGIDHNGEFSSLYESLSIVDGEAVINTIKRGNDPKVSQNGTLYRLKPCSKIRHCTCWKEKELFIQSSSSQSLFSQSVCISKMNCRLKRGGKIKNILQSQLLIISLLLTLFSVVLCPTTATRSPKLSPPFSRHDVRYHTDRYRSRGQNRCEKIRIPQCMDIGYNLTDMALSPSNLFKQMDAWSTVNQFQILIDYGCAEEMKLLICSIYTPICMPTYPKFLPPCRHICERAKEGCGPFFEQFQVDWPDLFECNKYPAFTGDYQLCLHFNLSEKVERKNLPQTRLNPVETKADTQGSRNLSLIGQSKDHKKHPHKVKIAKTFNATKEEKKSTGSYRCQCRCTAPMVKITNVNDPLYGKVETGSVQNCAMPCKSPYFSSEMLDFAESWITVWSVVCFGVTLITVCTFLIDANRFRYPERPIIFLSACYMFVSIGFLIRVVAGHEAIACGLKTDQILYKISIPFRCSIVFLLIYFFGMAGAIWWVFLSLTWFLAAGLKWGSEAIAHYSQYFHIAAWTLPALKSIVIIVLSSVDGDSLTGICYVGNQDIEQLKAFVIAPLALYLTLGVLFLVFGYINLCRIRISIRKGGKKTDTLEKLMRRIGLFSILYMVPSIVLLACHFYELQNRKEWENAYNCCNPNGAPGISNVPARPKSRPEFAVFMVKYSVTLMIGVTNGVWICSRKTITSWKIFYFRCHSCVCGLTGFIAWFKRQNMKSNVSASSSEFDVEEMQRTHSDRMSIESDGLIQCSSHQTNRRLSNAQDITSHDVSTTSRMCAPDSSINSYVCHKDTKCKLKHLRYRASEAKFCPNCLIPECSCMLYDCAQKSVFSGKLKDETAFKALEIVTPNQDNDGATVSCTCSATSNHCPLREVHGADECPSSSLLSSQAPNDLKGRKQSHYYRSRLSSRVDTESGNSLMLCGMAGNFTVTDRKSPPIVVDAKCKKNKVQHVHHHHHHLIGVEPKCLRHNHALASPFKNDSQKLRHFSLASGSSKTFFKDQAERQGRLSPYLRPTDV